MDSGSSSSTSTLSTASTSEGRHEAKGRESLDDCVDDALIAAEKVCDLPQSAFDFIKEAVESPHTHQQTRALLEAVGQMAGWLLRNEGPVEPTTDERSPARSESPQQEEEFTDQCISGSSIASLLVPRGKHKHYSLALLKTYQFDCQSFPPLDDVREKEGDGERGCLSEEQFCSVLGLPFDLPAEGGNHPSPLRVPTYRLEVRVNALEALREWALALCRYFTLLEVLQEKQPEPNDISEAEEKESSEDEEAVPRRKLKAGPPRMRAEKSSGHTGRGAAVEGEGEGKTSSVACQVETLSDETIDFVLAGGVDRLNEEKSRQKAEIDRLLLVEEGHSTRTSPLTTAMETQTQESTTVPSTEAPEDSRKKIGRLELELSLVSEQLKESEARRLELHQQLTKLKAGTPLSPTKGKRPSDDKASSPTTSDETKGGARPLSSSTPSRSTRTDTLGVQNAEEMPIPQHKPTVTRGTSPPPASPTTAVSTNTDSASSEVPSGRLVNIAAPRPGTTECSTETFSTELADIGVMVEETKPETVNRTTSPPPGEAREKQPTAAVEASGRSGDESDATTTSEEDYAPRRRKAARKGRPVREVAGGKFVGSGTPHSVEAKNELLVRRLNAQMEENKALKDQLAANESQVSLLRRELGDQEEEIEELSSKLGQQAAAQPRPQDERETDGDSGAKGIGKDAAAGQSNELTALSREKTDLARRNAKLQVLLQQKIDELCIVAEDSHGLARKISELEQTIEAQKKRIAALNDAVVSQSEPEEPRQRKAVPHAANRKYPQQPHPPVDVSFTSPLKTVGTGDLMIGGHEQKTLQEEQHRPVVVPASPLETDQPVSKVPNRHVDWLNEAIDCLFPTPNAADGRRKSSSTTSPNKRTLSPSRFGIHQSSGAGCKLLFGHSSAAPRATATGDNSTVLSPSRPTSAFVARMRTGASLSRSS